MSKRHSPAMVSKVPVVGGLLAAGPAPEQADATLILVHGRGGAASGMLSLYESFELPTLAAVAPQAAGSSWYPKTFLSPIDENQPFLDVALSTLESLVADLLNRGIPSNRLALLGFSQGACLVTEFAARGMRKYGALMGLSGGLIGPPGGLPTYRGDLKGVPVFLGASDPDPYVPFGRVAETARVLSELGAEVELRRYAGLPHAIHDDELAACRALLEAVVAHDREPRP